MRNSCMFVHCKEGIKRGEKRNTEDKKQPKEQSFWGVSPSGPPRETKGEVTSDTSSL